MKKLLSAALAALCAMLMAGQVAAQVVNYTDKAPTGERITVPASPPTPLPVRGQSLPVGGGTFATPSGTTNYTTTNNLVAPASVVTPPFTFTGACLVAGGNGAIVGGRYKTNDTGFAGKKIILKLHRDAPTYTNGDHGVWLTTESISLGQISITLLDHFSDPFEKGTGTPDNNGTANGKTMIVFDCAPGSTAIYGEPIAGETITPQGAKNHAAVLEIAH